MKLCKLKLRNLNSFRGEFELDFEKSPLDEASLVAITGPTGAGKTTLLDAICVALYGKTPRLAGTGTQNPIHLLSHSETDCHAEVHFVGHGVRYMAEWSLRRNRSPKGRLVFAENGALITDRLSSHGRSLGSSENTISDEIEAILGLDFDAFKRSVVLAQGEFAAFLRATNEERRTILETTAGVDIYNRLRDALNQKVREVESTHQEVVQQLSGIPEVTPEQFADSENHLRDLQQQADSLNASSHRIQVEIQREMERERWFSELYDARERSRELSNQQPEIATLEAELERATRANHLRLEKQAFDTAKSELGDAEAALRQDEIELADVQRRFDVNRTDFEEANRVYEAASIQHNQQTNDYNAARLDVIQATTRFTRAEKSEEDLLVLAERTENLSTELTEDNERYAALETEVDTIETFLADNRLPPDRQERLTSANAILAEHRIKQQQLTERSEARVGSTSEVSNLSTALAQLDGEREELERQQEASAVSLADADATLSALQAQGTLEEWGTRRQRAEQTRSVALQYETTRDQLLQAEHELQRFLNQIATLDTELETVGSQLAPQLQVCQEADEAVDRWEAERESALLVSPISQLRRHLRAGEPCPVCGATEHPCADDVESEGVERLEKAENALANAKEVARTAHGRRETLQREKIRISQNRNNITTQVEAYREEIRRLRFEIQSITIEWRGIYPNAEVSSDWISQQIRDADTAIENLEEARDSQTQASRLCQEISQQLDHLAQNVGRERSLLDDAKQSLQTITDIIGDLNAEITDIEARFWVIVPDAFHGIGLEDAVDQFDDKIRAVAAREREREQMQNERDQLNAGIRERQRSLETEQERQSRLQTEIESYRNEGNRFLGAVRDRTGGLTTINEIDTAVARLEAALEENRVRRNQAQELFQESQTALTEVQTNHSHRQSRYAVCSQRFEEARNNYLERLNASGFDSPEAHDDAFREEDWRQHAVETIATYTEEQRGVEDDIARLGPIFEENPFDSQVLEQITRQADEIRAQIREADRNIGDQQREIRDLIDALSQREALAAEIQRSAHELERWQRLQNTIPASSLRDFALDIVFQQMGDLANTQLERLTSGRYQLKVESIGKLTVVDRWNANEERPVETLSGGESFLTSLTLALALSELSRGRAQIHSLFLDEGFGTLDPETLDVTIAALEGLQTRGRSIFLISHVGELTRRIPVRIAVDRTGNGSSRVRVRG